MIGPQSGRRPQGAVAATDHSSHQDLAKLGRCGDAVSPLGDLFGYHGVKRAKLARDERAQVLAQLRGLPTAIRTREVSIVDRDCDRGWELALIV
jgi:hypothetical protein